jgi:hypothetical protein
MSNVVKHYSSNEERKGSENMQEAEVSQFSIMIFPKKSSLVHREWQDSSDISHFDLNEAKV